MPSASLAYSFPVPLGRRGAAAASVIALHVLLVVALLAGIAVQMPKVDVTLPPPAVRAPPRPETPLGRPVAELRDRWTFTPPAQVDLQPPELPRVAGSGDVQPAPVVIVEPSPPRESTHAARVLHSDEPPYPAAARRLAEDGVVLVRVLVGADGQVEQVELASSSGYARLDDAALRSVRRWRFQPAESGAGPIASWTTVRIVFRLTN